MLITDYVKFFFITAIVILLVQGMVGAS